MEDSKAKIIITIVFIILLFICFGKVVKQYILLQNNEYNVFIEQEQEGSQYIDFDLI